MTCRDKTAQVRREKAPEAAGVGGCAIPILKIQVQPLVRAALWAGDPAEARAEAAEKALEEAAGEIGKNFG